MVSISISLEAVSVLRAPYGGRLGYGLTFETLLRTLLFVIMDYMSHSAHQKCAPKTFSQPLVALESHYRQRHKSFC